MPGVGYLIFDLVFAFESFHSARGVDDLLLAGKEGMAFAAELHSEGLLGGARSEGISAGADYLGICVVFRVYLWSHLVFSL